MNKGCMESPQTMRPVAGRTTERKEETAEAPGNTAETAGETESSCFGLEIGRDTGEKIGTIFGVVLLDDTGNGGGFYTKVVADITAELLEILFIPFFAVAAVFEIGFDGSFKDFVVSITNGNIAILIEHQTKHPVTTGTGAEVGLFGIQGKGSIEFMKHGDQFSLDLAVVEEDTAGDMNVIGIAGVTDAVCDGRAIWVDFAALELVEQAGKLMVEGNHHDIGDERGERGALWQAVIEKRQA